MALYNADQMQNIEKDGFYPVEQRLDGVKFQHKKAMDLIVIVSIGREQDGNLWRHVSFSRQKRMPTYSEIAEYKSLFIGNEKYALMVFPPQEKHVNLHKFCLHLWEPLDHYPLPEFSGILAGVGRSI